MGHTLITGPGRAGTSFLMQLLTRMGCDTGFEPYHEPFNEDVRAGCEFGDVEVDVNWTIDEAKAYMATVPQVFKAPDWGWRLKSYLGRGLVDIDHVILPFRDLTEVALSRFEVGLEWFAFGLPNEGDNRLMVQIEALAGVLGMTIEACWLYHVPLHVMRYPQLIQSADYCYQRLQRVFELDEETFKAKHEELRWKKKVSLQETDV